jgi:hypothetical protein
MNEPARNGREVQEFSPFTDAEKERLSADPDLSTAYDNIYCECVLNLNLPDDLCAGHQAVVRLLRRFSELLEAADGVVTAADLAKKRGQQITPTRTRLTIDLLRVACAETRKAEAASP